nr:hypothetical protein [uncultured Flavobacterium sp.]
MEAKITAFNISGWLFGLVLITIGIANLFLVHPVPGIVYLLLSLIYFPHINELLKEKFGFTIPLAVKIILGIIIMWFTLGISDLAEICGL